MVDAREFGVTKDPRLEALEDVKPYLHMTPAERYLKFLDLMAFLEQIWKSIEPSKRACYDRANAELDDPGLWWTRVPTS